MKWNGFYLKKHDHFINTHFDGQDRLGVRKAMKEYVFTTNFTLEDNDYILVDSGFSGFAVVGEDTLNRHLASRYIDKDSIKFCSKTKSTYTFGAGGKHDSIGSVKMQLNGKLLKIDIVRGSLPFLFGRAFLRIHSGILDFRKDKLIIDGRTTSPAHKISLSQLVGNKPALKKLSAFNGIVNHPWLPKFPNVYADSSSPTQASPQNHSAESYPANGEGGQAMGEGLVEETRVPTRSTKQHTSKKKSDNESKRENEPSQKKKHIKSDILDECDDYNIFTALLEIGEDATEIELETAIIKGLYGGKPDSPDSGQEAASLPSARGPTPPEQLPPIRDRGGTQRLLTAEQLQELNAAFPAKVWFINAGTLRKMHLLRHSPPPKMLDFVKKAIPPSALRKQGSYPLVKAFLESVLRLSEAICKKCVGCICNGKEISRPIGLSVVPPFSTGMVDTMTLDYDKKLYALVVADLGTGMCWAFPIRGRCPPDGLACYSTYISRYAAHYGPHKLIVADRDMIFSGTDTILLWQQLGVERETTGAYAHFSLGSVERRIQMYRWAIDRIKVESPPQTVDGWEIVLSTISNMIANENDFTGTCASDRVLGRSTSLLRNLFTDTLVTATVTENEVIDLAEKARETYQHAQADRKLRRLINAHLPPNSEDPILPQGTPVAHYQERSGAREANYRGPATVIGFNHANGKYVLQEGGQYYFADRIHVRPWPRDPDEIPVLTNPARPAPDSRDKAPDEEMQMTGSHPEDRVDPPAHDSQGPDFRSLYHETQPPSQLSELKCGKCKNKKSKHAHLREPGCLLYKPDEPHTWSKRLKLMFPGGEQGANDAGKLNFGSRAEAEEYQRKLFDQIKEKTTSKKKLKQQNRRALTARDEKDFEEFLQEKDLKNNYKEALNFIEVQLESVHSLEEIGEPEPEQPPNSESKNSPPEKISESKYLHKWEDLPPAAQKKAILKSIEAYDAYGSWIRGKDLTDAEFKAMKRHDSSIIGLDCTIVLDAKIKNGELIGKVRIAPRGFRDNSEKAKWYSTSPTVATSTVRIAELLGMQNRLESYVFDISNAFFSGERLRKDEKIWIKIPRQILESENGDVTRPWRQLCREVPGCRGASSSWYRTLAAKLKAWGYEQCTTDQALFIKRKIVHGKSRIVGIVPVHVDDSKMRATPEEARFLISKFQDDPGIELSTVEKQERGKPIDFTGMTFVETEHGETIDQDTYIKNKLSIPTLVKSLRNANPDDELAEDAKKEYGTAVGRLIWLIPTQLKFSYEIAYLSRFRAYPRVKHFRRISNLIGKIKLHPQKLFLPRFHQDAPLKLITVVDAGAGEEADFPLKTRDHQCVCTMLVSTRYANSDSILPGEEVMAGVVSWSSCGVSRVSHASFDFEAICAVSSIDLIVNLRELIGEIMISLCPPLRSRDVSAEQSRKARDSWFNSLISAELHTDSMGLVKAVRLGLVASLTSRRRRDILDLRDCLSEGFLSTLVHIDGTTNLSDVGTKGLDRTTKSQPNLERLVRDGIYRPLASQDYQQTFENAHTVQEQPASSVSYLDSEPDHAFEHMCSGDIVTLRYG